MFITTRSRRRSSSTITSRALLMIAIYLLLLVAESPCDAKIKKIKMIKKLIAAKMMLKPLIKSGAFKAPMLHFVMPLRSFTGSSTSSSDSSSDGHSNGNFLSGLFSMQSSPNKSKFQNLLSNLLSKNRNQQNDNRESCSPVNCSPACVPNDMMENDINQQMDDDAKGKNIRNYFAFGTQTSESNADGTMAEMIPENFSWSGDVYNPETSANTQVVSSMVPQYANPNYANYQYSPQVINHRKQDTSTYPTKSIPQTIPYNVKTQQTQTGSRYYENKPSHITIEY